ncbi:MAG: histidine phosphatase family protein [Myxococcota bacterium]|nr:histidine phosphatase family protein [Myxococcota bacterium]
MSIYLIRHGQTAGNAARRLQTPDVPLDEAGLEQASRLGARLRDAGIVQVVSSDYTRAYQTAEAVVRETGAPHDTDPLLRERNFGELRGRHYDEVGPDLFSEGFEPPGGESWPDFFERAARAWEAIVARTVATESEGHLAIVTHGMLYRVLFSRHIFVESGEDAPAPGNTALSVIEPSPPHAVSLLACTAHLD